MLGPPLALAFALALPQDPPAPDVPPLELRVNDAIARAVAYVRGEQRQDGTFPGYENEHPGGPTALAAFALIKAGVRRDDPALKRALRSLDGVVMKSIYSASVHLLLCEALGGQENLRASAQASLDLIVSSQSQGVWAYPWGHLCASNTQFALMGLRAAKLMGLQVPETTLAEAADAIWMFQDKSGGGTYDPGGRPYAGVTAALLADCALLADMGGDSELVQRTLRKREKEHKAAEDWLADRFDLTRNTYGNGQWTPGWHTSYLWAVERWCGLTKQTKFAGVDWYREGASYLVDTQAENGSWNFNERWLENTCMALAFLRKATVSTGGEVPEPKAGGAAAERPPDRAGGEARRLTDWWLCGPWQGGEDGQILIAPPFDPAQIEPRERVKLVKRAWERVALKADGWTDLGALTKRDGDWQLWCVSTTLAYAPAEGEAAEPLAVILWLELEDGWDVLLDGRRVSHERRTGAAINGDVKIPLELTHGLHRLTVLVEDVGGAAAFGARITSATNGAPPATLTSWAEPPTKRGALQRK